MYKIKYYLKKWVYGGEGVEIYEGISNLIEREFNLNNMGIL